jgi:hypothetical protein
MSVTELVNARREQGLEDDGTHPDVAEARSRARSISERAADGDHERDPEAAEQ